MKQTLFTLVILRNFESKDFGDKISTNEKLIHNFKG